MPKQEALLVAVSCGIGTVVMSFLATRYFKQSKRAKKAKAFNRSVAQAQIESKEEVFVRGVVSSPGQAAFFLMRASSHVRRCVLQRPSGPSCPRTTSLLRAGRCLVAGAAMRHA